MVRKSLTIYHLENAISYTNQHGENGRYYLEAAIIALRELDPNNYYLPNE